MEEKIPQNINLTMEIALEKLTENTVNISIPKELRLTPDTFNIIQQLVAEQGFIIQNMNIAPIHKKEVEELENVVLKKEKSY